jgi:4-amino-4-deoxy-L-arabinose transferase-like glycosyltransferase
VRKTILALGLLAFLLFFYGLGNRDFWAPDEGDFAEVVRELDGDLIVPHLNGVPYAEKPPLFYYLAYLSKKAFSPLRDETSTRFVSAFFGLLFVLLFAATMVKHEGRETGRACALMLLASPLYYWQARYLQVDMLFAALAASSLLFFLSYSNGGAKPYLSLAALCLGFAFLTKGPLALVLVTPVMLCHLFFRKDLGMVKRKESILALALFLAVLLPWYGAVALKQGLPFLYENVVKQNFTRFFDAWSHKRPIYYYLTTLPLDFFPWSLFLPMGLIYAFRRFRAEANTRFFLIWFVWMFLFLSLSSGKISKYMLPLLPAGCVIASLPLVREMKGYNRAVFSLLSLVFLGLTPLLLFYKRGLYPEFHREHLLFAAICLTTSVLLAWFGGKGRCVRAFTALFSAVAVIFMLANITVFPKWNPYKSARPLCEKIRPFLRDGTPWVYYGSMRGVYIYYVGKEALAVDEHEVDRLHLLAGRLDRFYVLTRRRDLEEVRRALGRVEPVLEERIGDTSMVFVRYAGGPGR